MHTPVGIRLKVPVPAGFLRSFYRNTIADFTRHLYHLFMEVNQMKILWNAVNGLDRKSGVKAKIFLWILVAVNSGIGAGLWLLFGRLFLPGIDWLLCFIGYPAFFVGLLGGIFYLCNHEFA